MKSKDYLTSFANYIFITKILLTEFNFNKYFENFPTQNFIFKTFLAHTIFSYFMNLLMRASSFHFSRVLRNEWLVYPHYSHLKSLLRYKMKKRVSNFFPSCQTYQFLTGYPCYVEHLSCGDWVSHGFFACVSSSSPVSGGAVVDRSWFRKIPGNASVSRVRGRSRSWTPFSFAFEVAGSILHDSLHGVSRLVPEFLQLRFQRICYISDNFCNPFWGLVINIV